MDTENTEEPRLKVWLNRTPRRYEPWVPLNKYRTAESIRDELRSRGVFPEWNNRKEVLCKMAGIPLIQEVRAEGVRSSVAVVMRNTVSDAEVIFPSMSGLDYILHLTVGTVCSRIRQGGTLTVPNGVPRLPQGEYIPRRCSSQCERPRCEFVLQIGRRRGLICGAGVRSGRTTCFRHKAESKDLIAHQHQ